MDLIDLVGFAGAAVVLAAYALTNARSVRVTPRDAGRDESRSRGAWL